MPSKPDRYGIKFYILIDAENLYCQHAILHLEKESDVLARNLGEEVVKKICGHSDIQGKMSPVICI